LTAKDDDTKYLAGAIPEIDGKVVFSQTYDLQGEDANSIYPRVYQWLERRMKQNANDSRIALFDRDKGNITAAGAEYIVFSNSALTLDRSLMNYFIIATVSTGKCELRLERIHYDYQSRRYPAEEWITDKVALNKKQTSIVRAYRKFRIKTIDFAEQLFAEAIKEIADDKIAVLAPAEHTATPAPEQPKEITASASAALQGYKQIEPDKIPGNIIKMLTDDWMLITAGTDAKFNMMTASWGGLGALYSRPVATCYINPQRYTYQLMEANSTYTLSFYTEAYRSALQYCGTNSGRDGDKVKGSGLTPLTTPSGSKAFAEAWLIIECRKLVGQSLSHDALFDDKVKSEWSGKQLHKMYIGEIINVWVK
jgi:flavin reductase (DIM6/NTAB) family NADH-FMN oxidoreductase RutF